MIPRSLSWQCARPRDLAGDGFRTAGAFLAHPILSSVRPAFLDLSASPHRRLRVVLLALL